MFLFFWHVFPLCCFHVPVIYFKVISLNLIRRDIFTILLLLLPYLNYHLLLSLSPFCSIFSLHFLIDSTITSSILCSFLTKEQRLFLLLVLILMTGSGAATSDFWTFLTGTQPFINFTGRCHQLSFIDQPVKYFWKTYIRQRARFGLWCWKLNQRKRTKNILQIFKRLDLWFFWVYSSTAKQGNKMMSNFIKKTIQWVILSNLSLLWQFLLAQNKSGITVCKSFCAFSKLLPSPFKGVSFQ